jgi:hypothetical protein
MTVVALGLGGQDVVAALEKLAVAPKTAVSKKRCHIVFMGCLL